LLTERFRSKMQIHRKVLQRPDIPTVILVCKSLVTNSPLPPNPFNLEFTLLTIRFSTHNYHILYVASEQTAIISQYKIN